MNSWKFWTGILLATILITFSFQNCSVDNFGTEGNGTPYEGLSVGPEGRIGTEPDDDNQTEKPPSTENNGGENPNSPPAAIEIENIELNCNFNGSSLFTNLAFGTTAANENAMILTFADHTQKGIILDSTMSRQIPMDHLHSTGDHIDLIIYGTDSASITYTNSKGPVSTAMTSCH